MIFITHQTVILFILYMALYPVKGQLFHGTCCFGVPHVEDKSLVVDGCTNWPYLDLIIPV